MRFERRVILLLLVTWLVPAGIAVGVQVLLGRPLVHLFLEASIYLVVLLLLGGLTALQGVFATQPRWCRVALMVFLAAGLLGQLAKVPLTFPFTYWTMYSGRVDAPRAFVFSARTRSGREVPLEPSRLFPSLSSGRLAIPLRILASEAVTESSSEEAKAHLTDALAALASRYGALHPDDPAEIVYIDACAIEIGEDRPTCRRVWPERAVGP